MKAWTPDAKAALQQAGMSRRDFLKTSGALIVAFKMEQGRGVAPGFNGPGSAQLDSWIAIGADGSITAYTGKCELGHGLYTAQTQLIAEELSVPFNRVKLIQCDTALTPDQGTTSGAQSHPSNFNQGSLALAGATAREALLERASTRLGVGVDQLAAQDGVIQLKTDTSKKVTYGELVGGRKFSIALNRNAKRKPPNTWTVLGKPIPRIEIPAMAAGQFEYVHNVRVPGMLHGQVVRPPVVGATLASVDERSISGLPGVVKVIVKKNFVGVVAEKPYQAMRAANQLKVNWTPPPTTLPSHSNFFDWMRNHGTTRDAFTVNSKDIDAQIAKSSKVVKATYLYPYQMHGAIASSCAVADVQGTQATVWSATQAVYPLRNTVATVLGFKPEDVHVIYKMGSGCYGINGADTVSFDAALLSQAVGKPVRVQLTRKDEMAWENYGVAYLIDQRAGLDSAGNILTWDHESWSPTRGGRPGNNPGNVVTGFLAGFEPAPFAARTPAPDPTNYNNGSNAVPSYVTGCVGAQCGGTGTVASQRVLTHTVPSPFWTGPLRSPARLQNTFAHESFMDELAAAIKADPVEYRLRHLKDQRLIDVLKGAARAASWQTRPSPRSGARRAGVANGRGVSCVLYEGDNGYCAMVADVDVHQDSGVIVVKRLVIASDCGPISNPDGLRNQLEGGALHGVSRSLFEEVTWDAQKITSIDWKTYRPLFLGPNVPRIETVLINRSEGEAMGAGETAVTVAAAAIANAVFDATGARLRQVPFTPERVKAALT